MTAAGRFLRCLRVVASSSLLFCVASSAFAAPSGGYRVSRVTDGDTIELTNGWKVRYIGVNAPETHKRTAAGWQDVRETYGAEATAFNRRLVMARRISLEYDEEERDRYGRHLCYVYADDIFVNARLLSEGLAFPYFGKNNRKRRAELFAAFRRGFESRKNLFSRIIQDSDFRNHPGSRGWFEGVITAVRRGRQTELVTDRATVVVIGRVSAARGQRLYAYGVAGSAGGRPVLRVERSFHVVIDEG